MNNAIFGQRFVAAGILNSIRLVLVPSRANASLIELITQNDQIVVLTSWGGVNNETLNPQTNANDKSPFLPNA